MSGFEPYLEGLQTRERQVQFASAQAALRARSVAQRLAEALVSRYGATKVHLTGSLARGQFEIGSDIDLAAQGLSPDVFFAAGADIQAEAEGFAVDLVPIESATPAYLAELAREGQLLR